MKDKIIYLTGFMTSGKSTIGPILANTIGWKFFDLDQVIEENSGKTIVDIFEEKGEKFFRELEAEVLNKLSSEEKAIISLGGGTIANEENFSLIRRTGKLIYLKTSPEVIYSRIKNKINRPIFRDLVLNETPPEEIKNKIDHLLNKRIDLYEKADIIVNTDNQSIGLTVDELAHKLSKMLHE